jgi:hypothetical protein
MLVAFLRRCSSLAVNFSSEGGGTGWRVGISAMAFRGENRNEAQMVEQSFGWCIGIFSSFGRGADFFVEVGIGWQWIGPVQCSNGCRSRRGGQCLRGRPEQRTDADRRQSIAGRRVARRASHVFGAHDEDVEIALNTMRVTNTQKTGRFPRGEAGLLR